MKTKYRTMTRIYKGNNPLNICTRGWEDNIKTYLKEIKCDVVVLLKTRRKIRVTYNERISTS